MSGDIAGGARMQRWFIVFDDAANEIGPLISLRQRDRLRQATERHGPGPWRRG